jgi:serine/threonine protein kinase
MAPEQILGELVDARADLYAVGCMLYEAITGRLPFKTDVLIKQLSADPQRPGRLVEGLPPGLDDLIMRLLAKSPRDRIGHADDVAAERAPRRQERERAAGHASLSLSTRAGGT